MVTKAQARAAEEDAARQLTLEEELNELDGKIERLRILYEQFFIGVEKMEPIVLRKDVERTVRKLTQVNINNTGLRFRFQNQQQRMQVFAVHWGRVL
ncbi:MAG TPA: hypothetical protein VG389_14755, partial [Myxococcota bacterium]|nr:hypothetical protein [Myxococcota bacterium]